MSHKTSSRGRAAAVMVIAMIAGGCSAGREFRSIAGPAVQSGVSSILDGLVDAVFAVIEPDPETTG